MRKEWTFTLEATELAEAYQFMASLLPRNKRRRLALLLCVPALTLFTVFYFHWNGQPAAWVAAIGLCGLWIGKVSGWLWTIYLHNQSAVCFNNTGGALYAGHRTLESD